MGEGRVRDVVECRREVEKGGWRGRGMRQVLSLLCWPVVLEEEEEEEEEGSSHLGGVGF